MNVRLETSMGTHSKRKKKKKTPKNKNKQTQLCLYLALHLPVFAQSAKPVDISLPIYNIRALLIQVVKEWGPNPFVIFCHFCSSTSSEGKKETPVFSGWSRRETMLTTCFCLLLRAKCFISNAGRSVFMSKRYFLTCF